MYQSDKPIFFLHIPRTGGTTVDAIFFNNIPQSEIIRVYKDNEYHEHSFHNSDELTKIRYITGHLLLQNYNPLKIYDTEVNVFTFLRNPLDRLISEYTFYKTWPKNHLYKIINEGNISFLDYLISKEKILKYRGKNFMTRCISGKSFISGKHPYAALGSAKRQLEKSFFFFGILEFFNESILLLSDIIKLKNIFFKQHNKLVQGVKKEISENEKAVALELNRADCELYSFARDLFLDRIYDLGHEFNNKLENFKLLNTDYQNNSTLEFDTDQKIQLPK